MTTLRLRNGSQEAEPLVITTGLTLRSLIATQPTVFYEAVMLARDPGHSLWGDTSQPLRKMGLIDATGRMHESVRNVVQSSVEGDGIGMRLVNPVEPAPDEAEPLLTATGQRNCPVDVP